MSGVDQPIVIANCCYHVGHERSVRVADEQGFFTEEGLDRYVYQAGGLLPAQWEAEALGPLMWERGVDIATAVDVRAAVAQRARGEDVYIVGGWRTELARQLIAAKGITRPEELRGTRSAKAKDSSGLRHFAGPLRAFGIDPERDIEWIEVPPSRYGSDPQVGDLLRSGRVTLLTMEPGAEADHLVAEGYPLVLDTEEFYRARYQSLGAWPPNKVIVATKQTIDERAAELRAFLRANVRAFWFMQDPGNHRYLYELETRMRQNTCNEFERRVRMLNADTPRPPRQGSRAMGMLAMDGLVPRGTLADIIEDMAQYGEIEKSIEVDDVLKDAAAVEAYDDLLRRGRISREAVERWQDMSG